MLKQNLKIIFSLITFLTLPNFVWGAPSVSGVSGTIGNGQTITVSGNGFGATGPDVFFYDSFEKGTLNNIISTAVNSADIRQWTDNNSGIKYSSEYFHGGGKSMKMDWSLGAGSGPGLSYPNVQNSSILISWWQFMPTSSDVPGTNNVDGPNWKWFWIGDEGDNWPWGSDFVTVCLDNSCGASIGVFPADDTLDPQREGGTWYDTSFRKGTWMRFTVAMKNATSGAYIWNQELSSSGNVVQFNLNNIVTAHASDPWNILTLPGYGRPDNNAVAYYDDVYVATGNSARARIEIGNSATYSGSTNLTLLTPTSWGDSSISATVRQGSFSNGATAYLYVIDSTGVVNAVGYPITIGSGGGGDTTVPNAPIGLSVL
jgi:hypothetical protein